MRFQDPYAVQNGCTCGSTVAMARAAINGQPQPLCAVHDVAEIRQRASDERAEELERIFASSKLAFRELRDSIAADSGPTCTCLPLAAGLAAALQGNPPAPCQVHASNAPATNSEPLNGAPLPAKLAALLGATDPTPQDAA